MRCRGAAQTALLGEQVCHAAAADVGAVRQGGKGAQKVFELGVVVRPRVLPQHLDGAGLKAGGGGQHRHLPHAGKHHRRGGAADGSRPRRQPRRRRPAAGHQPHDPVAVPWKN